MRDPARARTFAEAGYEVRILDVTRPETITTLSTVDTVLYAVAYRPETGAGREQVTLGGLQNVLDALGRLRDRLIYVSTTGVYGQQHDEWIDERSPTEPQRPAGRHYLAAERMLQRHLWGDQSVILRMAGIYGPGRVPYLDRLRAGEPLAVNPNGYLNLIHVDDAVEVILASERARLPNLFVVADGTPVLRREYYGEVARWVGHSPTYCQPDPARPQAERAQGSKRIRTDKLAAELQVPFNYPSYRDGLAAILGGIAS
jgi:nucleoside-diphosphate-sugar epimerase